MTEVSKNRSRAWLSDDVIPLWLKNGIDFETGGFHEALDLTNGCALRLPRRALVQARQIYSLRVAMDLSLISQEQARPVIARAADFILQTYPLPSGGFIHSVDPDLKPSHKVPELYTQAFVLFGLAHAFAVEPKQKLKAAAVKLVEYLSRERRAENGGFTELIGDTISYQSNPHMHLFEAALAWMETDADRTWNVLAQEILDLCIGKFIDSETGLLAENFDPDWNIERHQGLFFFEPGHQYEWAWLMGRYQNLTSRDLTAVRLTLFNNAEKAERDHTHKYVYDQVWSDFTLKSRTARFWPQCERIKCASQLATQFPSEKKYAAAAAEAMRALLRYFETPTKGLWYDILEESGEFKSQPAKASSLYHIIGAIAEFNSL